MSDRLIFILLDCILIYLVHHLQNKIHETALKNKGKAVNYGENIVVGIVSGLVVLVLDRGMTAVFNMKMAIAWGAQYSSLFVSLFDFLVILTFEVALIFVLVLYLVYQGIAGTSKLRK